MRYLSVCSGIEAASVAWEPLGWMPVAFAEIEKFPATVLAHHWPHVPNLGDMTKINGSDFKCKIDVLVGGTPCQSFSIAGLRGGLNDKRGSLALEFVRIADESDADFVVWENVPGVLSDRGNAFGCFLAGLAGEISPLLPPGGRWTNAGYVLGFRRAIAWRVLDAQYFGLAQRRKRVFLIACPRDGTDPRKILFEFDGLRRDSAPSREAEDSVAGTLTKHTYSGGPGGKPSEAAQNLFICDSVKDNHWEGGAHPPLCQSHNAGGIGMSNQELFLQSGAGLVATYNYQAMGNYSEEDIDSTVLSRDYKSATDLVVIPINTQVATRHNKLGERTAFGIGKEGDPHYTLQKNHSHAIFAFAQNQIGEVRSGDVANTINRNSNASGRNTPMVHGPFGVRRLTPIEVERLQGFPDNHTQIPWRGNLAEQCPDGLRYQSLGNSMAVNVMRRIGTRIEFYSQQKAPCGLEQRADPLLRA